MTGICQLLYSAKLFHDDWWFWKQLVIRLSYYQLYFFHIIQIPIGMVRYEYKETEVIGKELKMVQMNEKVCCCCKYGKNVHFVCVLKPETPVHGFYA